MNFVTINEGVVKESIPFNVNHLKFFFDAASLGSVSKAAKKNFVSQSAISQGIKNLEGSLSCKLLQHKKSKFLLTRKGEKVFYEAKNIIHSLFYLQHKIDREESIGQISFGITHSFALIYLSDLFNRLKSLYPRLRLDIHYGESYQLESWVKSKKIDLALVLDHQNSKNFSYHKIYEGSYNIYQLKDSEVKDKIYSILAIKSNSEEAKEIKRSYNDKCSRDLEINYLAPTWEILMRFIESGEFGPGLLPDFFVNHFSSQSLKTVGLIGNEKFSLPLEIGLISHTDRELTDHLLNFLRVVEDIIKEG